MSEKIPMTREGYERLKQELEKLKKIERPKIIKEIEVARSYGDLSENAEYVAAKEKQGLIEAKIRELEYKLAHAEVVDKKISNGKVVFGSRVVLKDLDSGKIVEYALVGPDESDISKGKISITSPLGRSLIGKSKGDVVEVTVPRGTIEYEIVDVKDE